MPAAVSALLALTLSACAAPPAPSPPPPSPPPATATATIAFPTIAPTSTEVVPTQVVPPGPLADVGSALYATDFADAQGWVLGRDPQGATSLIDSKLSLVVPHPNLTRIARSPADADAANFVLDARMQAEVCAGDDEYGLVFRLGEDGDHLRFTVTCRGGVRLRRIVGGASRALVPFIPQNPAVMAGAPAANRLTVRAMGDDLALFVNEIQVLSARAPTLPAGGFGVVVASEGRQGQTTVTVDSFTLYELLPTATPAPTATVYQ